MGGSKIFSVLDGASVYWSAPLSEIDKEKTAFSVPESQFEMNVVAFGLCNLHSTYQRSIDDALKNVLNTGAYVDDT